MVVYKLSIRTLLSCMAAMDLLLTAVDSGMIDMGQDGGQV